jgi:hypothetical protein
VSDEPWYRFGLSAGVDAEVRFTRPPSADNLAALREYIELQIRIMSRYEQPSDVAEGREG